MASENLHLSYMTPQDIEHCTISDFNSETPHKNHLWSAHPSTNSIRLLIQRRCESLQDPSIHYIKIGLHSTSEIIASAKWHVQLGPQFGLSGNSEFGSQELLPEECTQSMFEFLETVHHNRQACLGNRPHVRLANLSTCPLHRRRGAASMLIQWGLDLADKQGIEAYTEAHDESRTLYEKFGFESVAEFEVKMRTHHGDHLKRYYVSSISTFSRAA
jgi:GNAT superfamily N-acetyltransferase